MIGCIIVYAFSFLLEKAMYKMMAVRANLTSFSMPFNPLGNVQGMLKDLGQGYQIFNDFLGDGSLKDYEKIYPSSSKN